MVVTDCGLFGDSATEEEQPQQSRSDNDAFDDVKGEDANRETFP